MLKGSMFFVAVVALTLTACKSPEQRAAEDAAQRLEEASKNLEAAAKSGAANVGDAMAAFGAAMGAAAGGKKVETVDFRALKDLLPESVAGMSRTDATGEKNAAMGMQISSAKGEYSDNAGRNATVTITDIGSMTGLSGMAAFAWAATDIDRESGSRYEKTTRFDGHKAMEKYDNANKSGEISVMVGDRFVVEAQGYGVEMDALKGALRSVNLGRLDSMKGQGVQ